MSVHLRTNLNARDGLAVGFFFTGLFFTGFFFTGFFFAGFFFAGFFFAGFFELFRDVAMLDPLSGYIRSIPVQATV